MTRTKANIHYHSQFYKKVIAILVLLLLTASLLTTDCDPLAPIEVRNGTSETITVFINDMLIGEVAPQNTIKNDLELLSTARYTITAEDPKGKVVYQETFTHQDL